MYIYQDETYKQISTYVCVYCILIYNIKNLKLNSNILSWQMRVGGKYREGVF